MGKITRDKRTWTSPNQKQITKSPLKTQPFLSRQPFHLSFIDGILKLPFYRLTVVLAFLSFLYNCCRPWQKISKLVKYKVGKRYYCSGGGVSVSCGPKHPRPISNSQKKPQISSFNGSQSFHPLGAFPKGKWSAWSEPGIWPPHVWSSHKREEKMNTLAINRGFKSKQ